MDVRRITMGSIAALAFAGFSPAALAQDVREFSFAYDQPKTTAYGFAGDVFEETVAECSNGAMTINQFPGAQLGQEPVMLEKLRAGDVDFIVASLANAATVSPELGVMSLHFLFPDEGHLAAAVASPEFNAAINEIVEDTVEGARVLTVMTLGFRNIYSDVEVRSVEDLDGRKIRVQATRTEDMLFSAYGAQPVHMPFGEVYTSLQTGVVDMAENSVNVYLSNKHYEAASVMSFTQHEANISLLWVSDQTWQSLTDEQKQCVEAAAAEVAKQEPPYALQLEQEAAERLTEIGVKIVEDVDKSGFIEAAQPIQDQLAAELGPRAVEFLDIIRSSLDDWCDECACCISRPN